MEFNRQRLTDIVSGNPGEFAVYKINDGKLNLLYCSPKLSETFGMSMEAYTKLAETDAVDVVLESDRPHVRMLIEKVSRGEITEDLDLNYRIKRGDGSLLWVHSRVRVLGMMEGCPVLTILFLNTSLESEGHAFLLDQCSAGVFVVDSESFELLYANSTLRHLQGREDYFGCRCFQFMYGRDRPCPWCPLPSLRYGPVHIEEFHVPGKDLWYRFDLEKMNWYGHRAVAVNMVDISREKLKQTSLEHDKSGLEKIIRYVPVGLSVCEVKGGAITSGVINQGAAKLLGITPAEFFSTWEKIQGQIHPDDRSQFYFQCCRLERPGVSVSVIFRFSQQGGQGWRWYKLIARSTPQAEGSRIFGCLFDVTAEKLAVEEMSRSRRMFRSAVDSANLVVWEYDVAAHRLTMMDNEATENECRMFGCDLIMDAAPSSLLQYIEDDDHEKYLQMYRDIENGAPSTSCDIWHKVPSNEEPHCLRICCMTDYDSGGKPVKAICIGQNVTNQKLAEERYQRFYSQLAKANPRALGTFQLNLTRNLCHVPPDVNNPLPKEVKLKTADDFFALISTSITDDKIRQHFVEYFGNREKLIAAFRDGHGGTAFDYPENFPGIGRRWIHASLRMARNPLTNDIEAVTFGVDITEQKENEAIMARVAAEKFDYIAVIDPETATFDLHIAHQQVPFAELHRKCDYEACRRYIIDCLVLPAERTVCDDATRLDHLTARLKAHGSFQFCYQQNEKGHSRHQLQYCWLDRKSGRILVICSNITEAYKLEQKRLQQMSEALHQAQCASRAKSQFVSRISHDIRTPLAAINSMTDFALADIDEREKLCDDLNKIRMSNAFLLSLINDVLDISKIDSGAMELHPEPYSYREYLDTLQTMFTLPCRDKGVNLVIKKGPEECLVLVDRVRINQVMLNLVSNAVKYTPAGGTVTIDSFTKKLPDQMIDCGFTVSDTGIGMSKEFQKKMFEPFTQEFNNPYRQSGISGTGLGLSIVKRIIDLMGGSIEVRSELGKGTSFSVRFLFPEAQTAAAEQKPAAADRPLSGTVLLAEDNEINTEIAVRLLQSFGLKAVRAENGQMALELFEASSPNEFCAVLMDLQMPIMDGFESAARIRALKRADARTVPIIALTADAFSEALERCKRVGMDEAITKPIDPDLLHRTLERLVQR